MTTQASMLARQTDEMRRRYAAGASLAQVAAEMRVSKQVVAYRLKRSGVQLRPRGRPRQSD